MKTAEELIREDLLHAFSFRNRFNDNYPNARMDVDLQEQTVTLYHHNKVRKSYSYKGITSVYEFCDVSGELWHDLTGFIVDLMGERWKAEDADEIDEDIPF